MPRLGLNQGFMKGSLLRTLFTFFTEIKAKPTEIKAKPTENGIFSFLPAIEVIN